MTDVPAGWAEVDLEDALAPLEDGRTIHQGWSPQCEKEPSEGNETWGVLKTTAIQSGAFLPQHNKRLPARFTPRPLLEVRRGDLLITCAGPRARCGVACLVRDTRPRLMLSGKMYRFRFDDRFVDPHYAEAYLLSDAASRAIDRMKTGISDSGLNLTHGRFRKLRFPVAPRAEQKRIVTAIEEQFSRLDSADDSLRRAAHRVKSLRASALGAATTGYPSVELGALVSELRYGTSTKCVYDGAGTPVIRIPNIVNGRVDMSDIKYAADAKVDLSSSIVGEDDLLFVRTNGSRDLIGRVAVVHNVGPIAFASYLIRARPDRTKLEPRYAAIALSTPVIRALIEARAATTAGQYNLNQQALRSLPIPLPPLAEQQRITAQVEEQLSVSDAMYRSIETARHRSAALRRSILECAFRGELVPHDSDDEPGSALVERMAAEHASATRMSRLSVVT